MLVLRLNHVYKSYPGSVEPVLRDLSLEIHGPPGDTPASRIGLVGPNGTGKTTLFRIAAGVEKPDSGARTTTPHLSIGYLRQETTFTPGRSVAAEAMMGRPDLVDGKLKLEELERQLAVDPTPPLLDRYGEAQERYERAGGYDHGARTHQLLEKMGLGSNTATLPTSALSGGEKTRLGICKLLVQQPHLLLLDEPTNHVDLGAVRWLEHYLRKFPGAVVVISHDRAFLDAVCSSTVELRRGAATAYHGNYSQFRAQRAAEEDRRRQVYEQQKRRVRLLEAELRRRTVWADRKEREKLGGPSDTGFIGHRAAKMMKRAIAARRRIERIIENERPIKPPDPPSGSRPLPRPQGRIPLPLVHQGTAQELRGSGAPRGRRSPAPPRRPGGDHGTMAAGRRLCFES